MSDVRWIKIVTDIFDDDKILLIESMPEADAIIVIWFKLLCLAGKQNNSGVFLLNGRIAYTDEMLATIFRRPLNTVRLALKTFEQFGMVEIVNDTITIPNWEKHQQLDALEASREATKNRVAKYRAKQKALTDGGKNTCNVTGSVTVTPSNADRINKNREDKSREEYINKRERDAHAREVNPFGEGDGEPFDTDTVQAYALNHLLTLGYRAMEELNSYCDDLSDDIVRHAIDNALDKGVRNWSYVRAILNSYVEHDVHSIADAKAIDESRKKVSAARCDDAQAEYDEDHRPRAVVPDPVEVDYIKDPDNPMRLKMYVIRRTGEEIPYEQIQAMCPGEIERFWDSRKIRWHN